MGLCKAAPESDVLQVVESSVKRDRSTIDHPLFDVAERGSRFSTRLFGAAR